MPIDRKRYPKNWIKIATSAKEAADWRCQHCFKRCLRPGEKKTTIAQSFRVDKGDPLGAPC